MGFILLYEGNHLSETRNLDFRHRKHEFCKIATYNIDRLISLPFSLFYSLIIFFSIFQAVEMTERPMCIWHYLFNWVQSIWPPSSLPDSGNRLSDAHAASARRLSIARTRKLPSLLLPVFPLSTGTQPLAHCRLCRWPPSPANLCLSGQLCHRPLLQAHWMCPVWFPLGILVHTIQERDLVYMEY